MGIKLYYSYKVLSDIIPWFNWPSDIIIDKSNIFLIQAPVGGTVRKEKIYIVFNGIINLLGVVCGRQDFEPGNGAFQKEKINYKKIVLVDQIISDNFLFPSIQLRAGYVF